MKQVAIMEDHERKVYDAIQKGWNMSGVYSAQFENHKRSFQADSKGILFNAILKWYESHLDKHRSARILVRCEKIA